MNKSLVIRTSNADGTSYNDFQWPTSGPVECPDWNPRAECGNGLHGLMWGEGNWGLLSSDNDALWQVIEVDTESVVKIDAEKVKFPRGVVVYSGGMAEAVTMVLTHKQRFEQIMSAAKTAENPTNIASGGYSTAASSGDSSTAASSGYSSTAASSGNYSKAASSGYYSKAASSGNSSTAASSGDSSTAASSGYSSTAASSGNYSTAASSGNYSKAASSGNYSKAASSGYSSTAASSGYSSTAKAEGKDTIAMAAGRGCVVQAGENGCFAAAYLDEKSNRNRILVGYVGEDGLLPNTPYTIKALKSGKTKWVKA